MVRRRVRVTPLQLQKRMCRDGACPVSAAAIGNASTSGDAASRVSTVGSLRYQQEFPGRLAPFQIAVGLCRLCQRINVFDPQLELPSANHSEYGASVLLQLLTSNDVVSQ